MSAITIERVAVEDLRRYALNSTVGFSWDIEQSEEYASEGTWTFWESVECSECEQPTDGEGACQNEDCERYGECMGAEAGREGPMMNYYYPFEEPRWFDPTEDAKLIADLPLCIVRVHDTYGLALTGGGMNLSWEIVEAFTRLGMLPPTDHVDLPRMAGFKRDERTSYLIAACRRALQVQIDILSHDMERLSRLEESLSE
jgi:hypothetical protein